MPQDLKCFLGLHKYGEPEVIEVTNAHSDVIKLIYLSRCTNCGKLHKTVVDYESYR